MTSPRFVAWAAVSSLPQAKKISLDDQIEEAKRHADRHGGEVVAELRVPGKSRSIVLFEEAAKTIAAYSQLRDLIKRKAFDVLIYLDRSRLGRKASLSMAVVELCHEAGIQTYEMESPPASLELRASHDDALLGAIKSVGAQQEVVKLMERHRKGMLGRVRSGKLPGLPTYGYRVVHDVHGNQSVVVEPSEAEIVRFVLVDCYLRRGLSFRQIAEELNEHYPRLGGWAGHSAHRMYVNVRRYAGYTEVNRTSKSGRQYTIARGNWEPILSEAELTAILTEGETRAQPGRRHILGRRFSRVCRCAKCGKWLRVCSTYTLEDGATQTYYNCGSKCRGSHIPETKLLAYMNAVIERLSVKAYRDAVVAGQQPKRRAEFDRRLSEIDAQLAELTQQKARLVRAYVELAALSDDEFAAQKATLDGKESALLKRAEKIRAEQAKAEAEAKLEDRLLDIAERGKQIIYGDVKEANVWLKRRVLLHIANNEVEAVQYR